MSQRLEFDLEDFRVLSRHLREVDLRGDFGDIYFNVGDHLPASGPIPTFDINDDPEKYVKQRLVTVTHPELPLADMGAYLGDTSSEDSELDDGDE